VLEPHLEVLPRRHAVLEELQAAIAPWSGTAFRLQHWYETIGQVDCLLYAGGGAAAWRLVRERWPLLERSFYLRAQSIRIQSLSFRARAAIAAASAEDDPEVLASAETDARRIEHERMPWGDPLARLLRAGIASLRGERAQALESLGSAERAFTDADMALHATIARRRRGELLGRAEGAALVAAADEWMTAQNIRKPDRIAAMLAPGAWS